MVPPCPPAFPPGRTPFTTLFALLLPLKTRDEPATGPFGRGAAFWGEDPSPLGLTDLSVDKVLLAVWVEGALVDRAFLFRPVEDPAATLLPLGTREGNADGIWTGGAVCENRQGDLVHPVDECRCGHGTARKRPSVGSIRLCPSNEIHFSMDARISI